MIIRDEVNEMKILCVLTCLFLPVLVQAATSDSPKTYSTTNASVHSYQLVDSGAKILGDWFPSTFNTGQLLLTAKSGGVAVFAAIPTDGYFDSTGFLVPQSTIYYANGGCQGLSYFEISKGTVSNQVSIIIQGKKLYLWNREAAAKSFVAQSSLTRSSGGGGGCQNGIFNLNLVAPSTSFSLALDLDQVTFPLKIVPRF